MSVDMQRMIDTAVSFFLGGERCDKVMSLVPNPRNIAGSLVAVDTYPKHNLGAATAANYALAVEVIFKCLILDANPKAKATGHELDKLFESMDGTLQQAILYNFSNSHQGWEWFKESLKPTYTKPDSEPGKKERSHLEIGRYPYEVDFAVFEIDFLREVFIACRKTLKAQNPSLDSIFERELSVVVP